MAVVVPCPTCGTKLKAAEALAGKSARCPTCSTIVQVPASQSSAAVSAPPPRAKRAAVSAPARVPEEEDDVIERPRKKPRKKRRGRGVPVWVTLAAVGAVLLVLLIGGGLAAYYFLGPRDQSTAASGQSGSSPSSERSGEATGGGVKYVPRESEKKLSEYLKSHEQENVTDEQVFAIMGEPTRRDAPITTRKNGQVYTVYKAYWEAPGSGVTSQIGFVNGRMAGAIIGLEVTSSSQGKK
jgi:hypothetical protein